MGTRSMSGRIRALAAIAIAMIAIGLPANAVVPQRVSAPPPVERAPADALYMARQFTYAKTAADVVYGRAVNVGGQVQELLLDVYEPVGYDEQFRPVIVWATGGGFIRAGKENLYFSPWLLERGYVVVSISYRIRPDLPYAAVNILTAGPDAVVQARDAAQDAQHDMQAAIRWVRANAADLRVDPTQVVAAGYSAGGIMSLMAAFNDSDPGSSGNPGWPSHIAAGVGGGSGYAPVVQGTGMSPGDPPIAIFHGAQDTEVPMAAAALPCGLTTAMGNVCEAHVYPGETHNMSRPTLWPDVAAESADFLWRRVINAPRTATQLVDVSAGGVGGSAQVLGRLADAVGKPLAGQRVLARATAGWIDAVTDGDGRFSVTVPAPDHGRSTDVLVRYEGHSTGNWLHGQPLAPTTTTVTATWGTGGGG